MSFETQGNQIFWWDIPGFCREIQGVPEKFEQQKKFVFNSRPLDMNLGNSCPLLCVLQWGISIFICILFLLPLSCAIGSATIGSTSSQWNNAPCLKSGHNKRGVTHKATKADKRNFSRQLLVGGFASKTAGKSALAQASLKTHFVASHFAGF